MSTERAYSQELSEVYDRRHFGGRSGQYILRKDGAALQTLLPPAPGLILDIPCGTGVYTYQLTGLGYTLVAADASASMAQITAKRDTGAGVCLSGIHDLPFANHTFDATVTLRLFSHFGQDETAQALRELHRVIKPGGRVVFDSFRWTPRRWPVLRRIMPQGYIREIAPADVTKLIQEAGLRVAAAQTRYLFSPIWQRKLPVTAVQAITAVESTMPDRWLLRTFWACTKDS